MKSDGYVFSSLLIIVAVIGILSTSFAAVLISTDKRHREEELRFNLIQITRALDDYSNENNEYPKTLDKLVEESYLRRGYKDPYGSKTKKWSEVWDYKRDNGTISSRSKKISLKGNPYREWRVVGENDRYLIEETGDTR